MITEVYSDRSVVVVSKPSGLPTAPLKNGCGDSLVKQVAEVYPEIMEVSGYQSWEGGLLHRLDTPTSGLVIFARNQKAFDYLSWQQRHDMITKEYRARSTGIKESLPGFPPFPFRSSDECFTITSGFRSYGRKGASVRPLIVDRDMRVYRTEVFRESDDSFICVLTQGFRHQVRCHMAWAGYPLIGDVQYGGSEGNEFGLEAIGLTFTDPASQKVISIRV